MGARQKLNAASVNGALVVAGLVGVLLQSWLVFLVLFAVFVALSVTSGEIRTKPGRK